MASWQAGSWRAGVAVSAGFTAVSLALYAAAFVLVRLVSPLASAPWFPLRHAVISLRRPGNQTRVILLAVGLGSFFVLGVRALQTNLIAEFTLGADRGGADMFLIDVQRDQVEGVRALLLQRLDPATNPVRLVPVLRARVTAVRGREVNLANPGDVRGQGSLAREYTITYRDNLEANEEVIQGNSGPTRRQRPRPGRRPRSQSSRASTSGSTSTSATRCDSMCSAGPSPRK